jgi:RNA polymerase sigma factor (sigma-70 family)
MVLLQVRGCGGCQEPHRAPDSVPDTRPLTPVPWKANPETNLQQQESCALVRDCVNQLPENYRTVLLLRDIEGLDTQETAQLLGTSLAVVKTRLHRARQALRTLLDPYFRRGEV